MTYDKKTDTLYTEQTFYGTRFKKRHKIRKRKRVNLDEPLYDNFPDNKEAPVEIPLTKEEKAFIYRNY